MAWNAPTAPYLQLFAGGKHDLDAYAKTLFNTGCGCDNVSTLQQDRLINPLQFDRGLNHLSPTGGRETVKFGNDMQKLVNTTLRNFINANGVGAQIEILAIPTASYITSFAVSVYAMDTGLILDVSTTRNGLTMPSTGRKLTVPATGCNPNIGSASITTSALATIAAPASTNSSEHYVFIGGSVSTFTANADAIIVKVAAMPSTGYITEKLNVEFDVSYETVLRLTR